MRRFLAPPVDRSTPPAAPMAVRGAVERPSESRTLRVAFYCDSGEIGGAEMSLANLVGALSPRIDPVVLGTHPSVVEWITARRPGTAGVLLPRIRRKLHLRAIAAHFRAIRKLRPDILHVSLNSPWAGRWAILSGFAVRGVRVVAVEQLPQPIGQLGRRIIVRLTAPRLAAHVAVGERSAGEVAETSGVDRQSIRTIYNSVPELELAPLPRPAAGPVIGGVGRLEHQKGFDLLVRALPELPGVTVVLVGEGAERARLVQQARDLGVSDRLVLTGWSEEPRRHLTTFDVFCLPSRFEGFPLVVVEAMLAGLPVVAADVGSVREALLEGETGLLVQSEDVTALAEAVRTLLEAPERRKELGRRGRQRALELFTATAMASAYEALYDEVTR